MSLETEHFRIVTSFFYQLYTLHVYTYNYYAPVVYYIFLTSKLKNYYLNMWFEISKLCNELIGKFLQVDFFYSDFEKAAHLATM